MKEPADAMTLKQLDKDWDRIMDDLKTKPDVAHVFGRWGRREAVLVNFQKFKDMIEIALSVMGENDERAGYMRYLLWYCAAAESGGEAIFLDDGTEMVI
jgi:hypothetical protein